MYLKIFGQEVAFAELDKAILDQIIEVQPVPPRPLQ